MRSPRHRPRNPIFVTLYRAAQEAVAKAKLNPSVENAINAAHAQLELEKWLKTHKEP